MHHRRVRFCRGSIQVHRGFSFVASVKNQRSPYQPIQ
ncbi:Uncharacterised protein [Vibrio cholerae]|nr:Uncharacterised protein [Vibrio cholerae]